MDYALTVLHLSQITIGHTISSQCYNHPMLGGIPVPTAWHFLGLRIEERPPDMEVSCEYIE
jgi:hypothetical protein